jgi:hypothetical protein
MKRAFVLFGSLLIVLISSAWAGGGGYRDQPQPPQAVDLRSWSIKIADGAKRFVVLDPFEGAAVLDMETQLVWARSPSTGAVAWPTAIQFCYLASVGGRMGWRLPTIEELTSLMDASTPDHLPSGHPFESVQGLFWSATTYGAPGYTGNAWGANFVNGEVGYFAKSLTGAFKVWCVRGGHAYDGGLNP